MTPRGAGGSGTPRMGASNTTPRASFPGGATPRSRDGRAPPVPQPSPGGPARPAAKSRGGNMWGDVAEQWGSGGRDRRAPAPGGGERRREPGGQFPLPVFVTLTYSSGYGSTPQYEEGHRAPSSSRTPMASGRTPSSGGSRTPGSGANRTPLANARTPGGGRTPGQDKRGTPRGSFGDATPLYDE